ncbi:MAG TPA: serine/threonine-protein kinase [Anaerolineales bacterium]|nr:serine/threonine-protein kinase [Anaerolineales bacterium]
MPLYPPDTLIADRYEVIQAPDIGRKILVGRIGLVYICRDRQTDLPVALKFFKPEYLPNRAARDRFLNEGQTWVELGSHPHIVRCFNVKYVDPTPFLVLERIANEHDPENASLCAWIGQPMPREQAFLFALQIARGMEHATEQIHGLVHRDLKPANILVSADKLPGTPINRLCVTDFGLMKIITDYAEDLPAGDRGNWKSAQVQLTGAVGTPQYMAPEQWKAEPVGMYTDIYALGCILYEMLSGQTAVSGHNANDLRAAHCNGNLRPMLQNWSGPAGVFLKRCLAVDPGRRYQAWKEVTTALVEMYEGLGIGSVPQESEQEDQGNAERRSIASSYNALGISYAQIGKAQKALEYFDKSLEIFQEINDRQGLGAVQGNLGSAYAQLGKVNEALGYFEQDLAIARELGDRRREAITLGNLGEVYRNLGDVRRAIDYHEQRLEITRQLSDRRSEGNTLCSLGLAYFALGDTNRAISCHEQQLIITREISDRRGEGNALCNRGNAYAQLGKVNEALADYNQYLRIARELGDRRAEGNALGNLGNAHAQLNDLKGALLFYQMRLDIAQEIGDRLGESNALGNLGIVYTQLGELQHALEYYEQRLKIAGEIDDLTGICSTLFNMGHLYVQIGQVRAAAHAWGTVYVLAKQANLDQALQRLSDLAPKVGLPEGLNGWEALAQHMQEQGLLPGSDGIEPLQRTGDDYWVKHNSAAPDPYIKPGKGHSIP